MTKHNIWSISIITLLCATLFTPLIVASNLYFPYVTGKVFAFRGIVSVLAILYFILIIIDSRYLPKKSSLIYASGLFVLWLAVANMFGVDRFNSFFSNFERMEGWFTHLYLFIYLVILSSVIQKEAIWNWLLNISVVVANIVALTATFDVVSRTQVLLGNSTYVAIYILFNLFFAVLLLYRLINKKTKESALKYVGILYYVSSILLFVYIIFRTQTRGTVLALVFSTLLFFILSAISYWKNKKVRIISVVLFVIGIVGAVLFWQNRDAAFIQNNPMLSRVATISATEGTGKARLVNWGIALEGIKEKPIVGWGQENYTYVFAQKYDPRMYNQEPWFDRTHNAFLDWTIQGGIPALLFYLSLFALALSLIHASSSLTRFEKNILISLLFAYGIHNMFVFDNYSSYLMFFFALGFVVFHSNKDSFSDMNEKMKQLSAIILIACIVIVSIFTIFKPIQANAKLIQSLKETDQNKILDIFQNIFNMNTFATSEAGIRLMASVSPFLSSDDQAVKNKYVQVTGLYGQEFEQSNDVRKLEVYGTYLMQIGNSNKSIDILEKARTLAPNRQNNLHALGLVYVNAKEFDKAKEVFKHAYQVLPENQKARTYYGALLVATGDQTGKDLLEGYSYKDNFFISIFGKTGKYGEVIKIREQLKKDNPTDYQNQVSLAVAYYLNKQPARAIALIQEVQKAVPEFKGQGDYLIKEMRAGRPLVK